MRSITRVISYGLALLALGAPGALAQEGGNLVLDDFDASSNDELGGPRVLALDVLANPFSQLTRFDVLPEFSLDGGTGALVFHAGIAVEQTASITWDNNGAGLGLDLSEFAGLELDILQADQDFGMSIRALDAAGKAATWQGTVDAASSPTTRVIAFSRFGSTGAFDAANVDSFVMTFNTGPSVVSSLDFVLGEVRTSLVPAPASIGVLALSGLFASRRRR
ncbi:MAG: hypothetical protein ACF8Q5_02835 [Phycisphaerales bacterium JB040]